MFLQHNKYYFGVSIPEKTVDYDLWVNPKMVRRDYAGSVFLEWKGYGSNKNIQKKSDSFNKFIAENNLYMTISDRFDKKTPNQFLDLIEDSVEFNSLMEKTNGQGTFKEINVSEAQLGAKFNCVYEPTFEKRISDDGVYTKPYHRIIESEEFTTLDDYKNMKLLQPLLSKLITKKFNVKNEITIFKTEFGWKFLACLKDSTLFERFVNYGKPNLNFNEVFSNDLDLDITFDEYLKYYMKDESFFSYYNYKSGVLMAVSSTFKFLTIGPANEFYKTHLMKPWKII